MKLTNSLFSIIKSKSDVESVSYTIKLNSSDIVYKGHFPGFPVTPGVIQIKIVEELLGNALSKKFRLDNIHQSKFLQVVNPNEDSEVFIYISYAIISNMLYKVNASFTQKNLTVFKLQAEFSLVQ